MNNTTSNQYTKGALFALAAGALALTACSGGSSRPSVGAIIQSLDGAEIVSELSDDEVGCFAQELHDGSISDGTLVKFVNNDDVNSAEISEFEAAASSAAPACGFMWLNG